VPPDDVPPDDGADDQPGSDPGWTSGDGPTADDRGATGDDPLAAGDHADMPAGGRSSRARRGDPRDVEPDDLTFVMPSTHGGLITRLLVLAAFLLGWLFTLTQPQVATVRDLVVELDAGAVSHVLLEQSEPADSGTFEVSWQGTGGPAFARYEATPDEDWGTLVREAANRSPSRVDVRTGDVRPPVPGKGVIVLTSLFGLGVLLLGPEPRLATTWGWLWLCAALSPLWLVFLAVEPTPLWVRRPLLGPRFRLGGGVAGAVAIVLALTGWLWLPDWVNLMSPGR
jgi:hypothetical protein